MTETRFDVVGIGNAIVDVLAHAEEEFLVQNGLNKGTMTLIDPETADGLYKKMAAGVECSGGSAANTIAALASLGGQGAFIGKVKNDDLGEIFGHDIRAAGVAFDTPMATEGVGTARCLIFVTSDAQRTMQTYLGACVDLGPNDVDPELIASAKVTYLEGYLWDPAQAKQAFIKAADAAHNADREVSLSLSDPFCVDRHRDSFVDLVNDHVDILFANEEEIKALYQVDNFDDALQKVRGHCKVAALTRGEKGSIIISGDEVHIVDAEEVSRVVDTTGAGDAYAAGFLFGYTNGKGLAECARLGGIASGEVISHYGARPETPLDQVVKNRF
ncbi:MAG: adenosine kinase [Rhodospirillales bacterium]|nr:adenosine kinase [Rhodospirillales bacterium]